VGKNKDNETVVIIGGNRGIGEGFVKHYLAQGCSVIATYRDPTKKETLEDFKRFHPERFSLYQLDVREKDQIQKFSNTLKGNIDILILSAGIIRGARGSHPPDNTVHEARELMEVNTYGPDNVLRALHLKMLHPHSCTVYISSTLAHTGSNLTGRHHHYRASKAAGNILMQDWNIELARIWLESGHDYKVRPCVFPLSPGVVKTDMSGGAQSTAPLTVEESVEGMASVISTIRQSKKCSLYLYDGSVLEKYPEPLAVTKKKEEEAIRGK
jgi:NAD(P)-dependent dehydrogenase (short-subunit alcohol dehydrogenase family)